MVAIQRYKQLCLVLACICAFEILLRTCLFTYLLAMHLLFPRHCASCKLQLQHASSFVSSDMRISMLSLSLSLSLSLPIQCTLARRINATKISEWYLIDLGWIIIIILMVIAQNLAQWFALQTPSTATCFAVGGLASVGGAEFVLSHWFGVIRWLAIGRSRVRLQFWQVLLSPSNIIWYRRKNRKGNVWLWKERSCAVCKLMPTQGYETK